jgi:hypothetical protein
MKSQISFLCWIFSSFNFLHYNLLYNFCSYYIFTPLSLNLHQHSKSKLLEKDCATATVTHWSCNGKSGYLFLKGSNVERATFSCIHWTVSFVVTLSRFRGAWLLHGVWFGWIGFIDHLYTPLRITLYRPLTHTQTSVLSLLVSTSRFLAMAFTSGDSSASRTQFLLSQPPVQNSCQLTTQLSGSQAGGHFTPISSSSLHRLTFNWTDNWSLSLTTQLLHVTSLNRNADNLSSAGVLVT